MTSTSPRRSARDACFSHSLVKRWISVSSGASARRSTSSAKAPPASTDWSWCGVADEQHLGARACGDPGDPVECRRVREGRLVDDHQLPARGARCGRGRTRGATSPCCRTRRRGRRPTPGPPRRTAPDRRRSPARARRSTPLGALASWWSCLPLRGRPVGRPGAPSWQMLSTRTALLRAQLDPSSRGRPRRNARGHRRRGHLLGTGQQPRLGLEDRGRGVLLAVPRPEHGSCRPRAGTATGLSRELRRGQRPPTATAPRRRPGRRRPRGPRSSRTAGPSSASTPRP